MGPEVCDPFSMDLGYNQSEIDYWLSLNPPGTPRDFPDRWGRGRGIRYPNLKLT